LPKLVSEGIDQKEDGEVDFKGYPKKERSCLKPKIGCGFTLEIERFPSRRKFKLLPRGMVHFKFLRELMIMLTLLIYLKIKDFME